MSADAVRLEEALRAAFERMAVEQRADARDVRVRVAALDETAVFAHPEEERLVARAVESRRRELATGRRLAHALLAELGADPAPLLPGERRAPVWPAGFVGSISHAQGVAAVVVARSPPFACVGLDVEGAEPLKPELVDVLLTASEKATFSKAGGAFGAWAKLAFCAKECAYKAWSPALDFVPEFTDVEVELDAAEEVFVARLSPSAASGARLLRGACARTDGRAWAASLAREA